MSRYKVQVGGFVSTYRERTFEVYGKTQEEAEDKAINMFIEAQQQRPGNMCDEGTINSIELM